MANRDGQVDYDREKVAEDFAKAIRELGYDLALDRATESPSKRGYFVFEKDHYTPSEVDGLFKKLLTDPPDKKSALREYYGAFEEAALIEFDEKDRGYFVDELKKLAKVGIQAKRINHCKVQLSVGKRASCNW